MIKICDRCKKPIIYEGDSQKSKCICESPLNPWECDEEVFPMLSTLWKKGYDTDFSCSGHPLITYRGDSGKCYVKSSIDSGIYIAINAPTVKIKNLDKWKYGSAYIRLEDGTDAMIHDISLFVDLPEGWKFDPFDPIIQPYMDMVGEEQAKNLREWVTDKTFRQHYVIRCEYHDDEKQSYINRYMNLLNDRFDVSQLIDILPVNE